MFDNEMHVNSFSDNGTVHDVLVKISLRTLERLQKYV